MTEPPPLPAPPAPGQKSTLSFRPSFWGGLRGVWLFTWRSQLTWRHLPTRLVMLLVLPVLIYLTTINQRDWAQRFPWIGKPPANLADFSRRLGKVDLTLQPQQASDLLRIYAEEYARAEGARNDKLPPEERDSRRIEEIKACHERVVERAKAVLDDRLFAQFRTYDGRRLSMEMRPTVERTWGRSERFYHWLVDFYFFMIVPLVCVRGCGALIRDELQSDTLSFLTTRPLTRARLLVFKFLAEMTWLQLLLLAETLLVFTVGAVRDMPALGPMLMLFLGAQVLAVAVWSALGVLLGQVTQRYMAVALVYGFIVELGIGRIPTNINTLSMMRHLKSLLGRNEMLQAIYYWPLRGVPFSAAALVCAAGLFLGLAVLLFNFLEYHHTSEMQK